MSPPQVPPKGDNGMHTCDLLIYDEESDRHVRITWEEALEATLVFDNNFWADASGTEMADGDQNKTTLSGWYDKADAWSTFNKGGSDYKTAAGENGKNLDCRIIVARPFIEHLMVRCSPLAPLATRERMPDSPSLRLDAQHNVVMTVAGRDTGATLFGPADSARRTRLPTRCPRARILAHPLLPVGAQCNSRRTRRSRPSRDTCAPTPWNPCTNPASACHRAHPRACLWRAQYTGHFKAVVTCAASRPEPATSTPAPAAVSHPLPSCACAASRRTS
jgi:hypothetical protein